MTEYNHTLLLYIGCWKADFILFSISKGTDQYWVHIFKTHTVSTCIITKNFLRFSILQNNNCINARKVNLHENHYSALNVFFPFWKQFIGKLFTVWPTSASILLTVYNQNVIGLWAKLSKQLWLLILTAVKLDMHPIFYCDKA